MLELLGTQDFPHDVAVAVRTVRRENGFRWEVLQQVGLKDFLNPFLRRPATRRRQLLLELGSQQEAGWAMDDGEEAHVDLHKSCFVPRSRRREGMKMRGHPT